MIKSFHIKNTFQFPSELILLKEIVEERDLQVGHCIVADDSKHFRVTDVIHLQEEIQYILEEV